MAKSRRQDTKTEKTERDITQKLRANLREAKKEIERLKKELNRRQNCSEEYQELLAKEEEQIFEEDLGPVTKNNCPACGAEAITRPLGKFVLTRCSKCKWRQRT